MGAYTCSRLAVVAIFAVWSHDLASAFAPITHLPARLSPRLHSHHRSRREDNFEDAPSTTTGYRPGSLMAATMEQGRVPYGEESRKYRRTVFGHDDWVQHRNSERIITNIKGLFFSGIIRQLRSEVLLVTAVSALVLIWNDVLSDSLDLPLLSLPPLLFTLSSPALGLLLVFRTNASFSRWLEARNTWAKIISQSRNMVRMAATFSDLSTQESQIAVNKLSTASWLFCRTLMNQLYGPEDEPTYQNELRSTLSDDHILVQNILDSPQRTMAAMTHVSLTLDRIPIDEKRRVEIDKSLVLIGDFTAICEKIYTSPVPLVYTRHAARFLTLWMLTLPVTLYHNFEDNGFNLALIPAMAVVALFLFGIEELAIQLEEPFSILPMQKFCDDIKKATDVISDWSIQNAYKQNTSKDKVS